MINVRSLFGSLATYFMGNTDCKQRLTLSLPIVPLTDFTLSNARRFYSSMGNPMGLKGLNSETIDELGSWFPKNGGSRKRSVTVDIKGHYPMVSSHKKKSVEYRCLTFADCRLQTADWLQIVLINSI